MSGPWEKFKPAAAPGAGPWGQAGAPLPDEPIPTPPPGAIIHGSDGVSRVAGAPGLTATRTGGEADLAQIEALRRRAEMGDGFGGVRRLLPLMNGLSLGWGNEAVARVAAAMGRGDYASNLAVLDQEMSRAREERPIEATALDVAGGIGTGVGLAAKGLTSARYIPQAASGAKGLGLRMASGLADGIGYGAIAGAGTADEGERLPGAATGALVGAVAGGAAPAVASAGGKVASAVGLSPAASRARDRVALVLQRSGVTPDDIERAMVQAADDGQPEFMVADAMGRAGAAEMGRLSRTASQTADDIARIVVERNRSAPNRLITAMDEAATGQQGMTATRLKDNILTARQSAARVDYGAAREGAGAVDVSPAINAADEFLSPGATGMMKPQTAIADDSVEAAVRRARSYLTDGKSQLTDFDVALRAKVEIDSMIERASPSVQRHLIAVRNALDGALESASPGYAAARDGYRVASRRAESVDIGREMAMRGRSADNVATAGSMPVDERAAAAVGYADPIIQRLEKAKPMSDPTADLLTTKRRQEIPALFGMRAEKLMRQSDRERQMFETMREVAGNSATARRLAEDISAGPGMGGVAYDALTLNAPGLLRRGLDAGLAFARGERAPVQEEIARILMQRGPTQAKADLERILLARGQSKESVDRVVRSLLLSGGVAATSTN